MDASGSDVHDRLEGYERGGRKPVRRTLQPESEGVWGRASEPGGQKLESRDAEKAESSTQGEAPVNRGSESIWHVTACGQCCYNDSHRECGKATDL